MSEIQIVPATRELLQAYSGEPVMRTVHAIVAIKNGKVIGAAGFYADTSRHVIFTGFDEEMKQHKREILRGARMLLGSLGKRRAPVHASRNANLTTADGFLRHFGFRPIYDGSTTYSRES